MMTLLLIAVGCGFPEFESAEDAGLGPQADTSADDDSGGETGDTDDTPVDADGDGVVADEDCDDADAGNFPGNAELCDGLDNDCSGAPEVDGDGACQIWTFTLGDSAWEAHALNPSDTVHAPSAPIEVAFSVGSNRAWALTHNSYHVVLVDTLEWIASGDRDTLFPEVAGRRLRTAFKSPHRWNEEDGLADVYLTREDRAFVYTWDPSTGGFEHALTTDFGRDWQGNRAPEIDTLKGAWYANDTGVGWTSPSSPRDTCGANADSLGPYLALLTTESTIYLWDGGYCEDFVSHMAIEQFSVFALPGAPDGGVLDAVEWTGAGLIAFGDAAP
jgi:hypothetical protein